MLLPSKIPQASSCKAKVLIFDFDGTVADTRTIALRILNELSQEFHFRSLPEEEIHEARNMTVQKLISFLGVSRWRVPMIARRGLAKFQERISEVKPIAEMPEILAELKSRGFQLGILTSNSEFSVTAFLKQHHIDCFEFISTSSKLLGKSREIRKLMKEHQWNADEIIYIGDETRDIEATKSVPIRIAAVTWGYNSASILATMDPDFIFDQPKQLLTLQPNH
ncbi:MAG: HAD-IA family hydrolase [Verrucomicrobia bacterium]|jgi:phosphoglycolate phosphatase|nr:MAG: HAD-IA family hydrolase [Verrucomicrobiota bacterium]MDH4470164.1 HAD-IA family hydrolase [Verrucomicrobiae bacterium]